MKFRKIPHLKHIEKRGCNQIFYISVKIASENLKKFMVIHCEKWTLMIFAQIFLSNRMRLKKYLLISNFFQCYLNGKSRALPRVVPANIWPSHHIEYFSWIIWRWFPAGSWKKKSIWEIRNTLVRIVNRVER